jgi:hypothetical protein
MRVTRNCAAPRPEYYGSAAARRRAKRSPNPAWRGRGAGVFPEAGSAHPAPLKLSIRQRIARRSGGFSRATIPKLGQMHMSEDEEAYGPEYRVWNHLYSGLDLATMELNTLEEESRKRIEKLGKLIAQTRSSVSQPLEEGAWIELFDELLKDPWVRYGAELALANEGVDRAAGAIQRFVDLRPVLTTYQLGVKATSYLQQVTSAFLFEFDAAAIALAGAALEQVLRDVAIESGSYTEARLRREQPTGQTLLENAKREGKISSTYDAAKRVLERRNHVMHRSMWEDRIIKRLALESISDLGLVLSSLPA